MFSLGLDSGPDRFYGTEALALAGLMIVCSCRVLTDRDFVGTLESETPECPRTAVEAYKCLGCSPECGRCLRMVKRILHEARASSQCETCHEPCAFRDTVMHGEHRVLQDA